MASAPLMPVAQKAITPAAKPTVQAPNSTQLNTYQLAHQGLIGSSVDPSSKPYAPGGAYDPNRPMPDYPASGWDAPAGYNPYAMTKPAQTPPPKASSFTAGMFGGPAQPSSLGSMFSSAVSPRNPKPRSAFSIF